MQWCFIVPRMSPDNAERRSGRANAMELNSREGISASPAARVDVPLLVPELPTFESLKPYLRRIDAERWYSNFGPLVVDLEHRLAHTFVADGISDVRVITVGNATAGLELALRALNLPANSPVLVPAFTFVATATAVLSAGLTPIVADVDTNTWLLTPEIAMKALSRADVRAVIPVCAFGCPQPAEGWSAFRRRTGIPVVIDAAAAFGNQREPGPTCAVFSMHATKPLASGEGGFIVTRSREFADDVRQMSNFGINLMRPDLAPIGSSTMIGTNAKLSEYHAAVGLASLDAWAHNARRRRELYASYRAEIEAIAGLNSSWQEAPIDCVRSTCAFLLKSRSARDRTEASLATRGVATRRWYSPTVDRHPAFARITHLPTPVAHDICDRLLGVPFYIGLSHSDRTRVVEAIATRQ